MNDNQHTPVTDDQELANVLAGMNQQAAAAQPAAPLTDEPAEETTPTDAAPDLQFEESPLPTPDVPAEEPSVDELPPVETAPVEPSLAPELEPEAAAAPAVTDEPVAPIATPSVMGDTSSASPELDSIKKEALEELRPLVDKLDLPADEKFDTLLLVIRSTDDKSLVSAAHEAARAIPDEGKRAQALLDVIKEIDYFAGQK